MPGMMRSPVCLLAFVAVTAATEYAIFESYISQTCDKSATTGIASAYALGVCSGQVMASSTNGTISITKFEDQSCTQAKEVVFAGKVNVCGPYRSGFSGQFTSVSQTFGEAYSNLVSRMVAGSPLTEQFQTGSCTGIIPFFRALTSDCVKTGTNASLTLQCETKYGPVQTRSYSSGNCQGHYDTDRTTSSVCLESSGGSYATYVCGVERTTSTPPSPNNKKTKAVSGGVVAAAILIPLVIIIIIVVAVFFVCRNKKSALDSDLTDEPTTSTNYGSV